MNQSSDDKPTKPQSFKPDHPAFPQTQDYQIDPSQLPSPSQQPPETTAPPLEVTPTITQNAPASDSETKKGPNSPSAGNDTPEKDANASGPLTPDMLRHIREEDEKKEVIKKETDPHKKRFYTSMAIGIIALVIFGGIIVAAFSFFNNRQSETESKQPQQTRSVCGNKKVEAGEACDDGNLKNGDGCSSGCQFER